MANDFNYSSLVLKPVIILVVNNIRRMKLKKFYTNRKEAIEKIKVRVRAMKRARGNYFQTGDRFVLSFPHQRSNLSLSLRIINLNFSEEV